MISVLDPRNKLQYFCDQSWPDGWIAEARFLVRQAYDEDWKGCMVGREQSKDSQELPVGVRTGIRPPWLTLYASPPRMHVLQHQAVQHRS